MSSSPQVLDPSGQSRRKLRTRDAIVAGASQVLAERGLSAMTVDDILEVTGVARATFYAHFNDKHHVTREVVTRMWRRTLAHYSRFAAMPVADATTVRLWLAQLDEDWRAHHKEVEALLRDFPVELSEAGGAYLDEFVAVLVGDGSHWRCSTPEARCRARLLIVQLERTMLDVYRGAWRIEMGDLLATLTTLWLLALHAP